MRKEYTQEEKDMIVRIVNGSFGIEMNANDFFAYACADGVTLDPGDLPWVLEIISRHGEDDGINACLSYIRNQPPIEPWITEGFKAALADIEAMKPKVLSEDGYYRPKEEQD